MTCSGHLMRTSSLDATSPTCGQIVVLIGILPL